MLSVLKSINLALAFLLELAMLAAFAWWGYHTGQSALVKIGLGICAPLLAALIWGWWMAPNSYQHLQGTAYLAVKALLFALAVTALITTGMSLAGILLAVIMVINTILLFLWKQ